MPVKPSPASPVPAATLVLLRDRPGGGVEVLLMQRHRASKFAAGAFVFPGGKVEAVDAPADAARLAGDLDPAVAARRLGLDAASPLALGAWLGVIRETFEEVGVLLARTADGHPVRLGAEALAGYRRACRAEPAAFWAMVRAERLTLAADRLVYFAHWITPEEEPLRFDTRFFAAEAPAGQAAVSDDHEAVELRWLAPAEALAAFRRGELPLRNPTVRNLMLFEAASSAAAALDAVRDRAVPTIRPRVITENGGRRVLMPGDPGYW